MIGTYYFTKWVEAKHRYLIWGFSCAHLGQRPSVRQKTFGSYCGELGITNMYSTPAYPQGNGQAETVNKVIVNGLKKRLDDAKGKWVEELPHVL